jgi:hypothetical protein
MPFQPGFDRKEALELLILSAQVEDAIAPPIPPPTGWTTLFTSPEIGPFQNKWQLSRRTSDGAYAVAIRGTIMTAGSVLDDLLSLMIAGKGQITFGAQRVDYKFAADTEAGVHLGFALGALLLLLDPANGILVQLQQHGAGPGSSVYVTGHSQGAAIATLVRSYIQYAAGWPSFDYKTYVYAQPKPGNVHYADDVESTLLDRFFRVTNTLDWVPEVPFTLQFIDDIDEPNPLSVLASKPTLLALIEKAFDEIRALIQIRAQAQLQAGVPALMRRVSAAPSPPAFTTAGITVPFLSSLDFVNAGDDFLLLGKPCAGAECQDAFFEHHATTYYALLNV